MDQNEERSTPNGVSSEAQPEGHQLEVKELFGILLDAAEAVGCDDCDQEVFRENAQSALNGADRSVADSAIKLLEAHHRADTGLFCEHELLTRGDEPSDEKSSPVLTPPLLDGYVLGEEIGRGGFGVVFRAEQLVPVRRPVAIKLLRTDLATPEMVARFRAEASVLARMNHEGVARVIDAGLDQLNRPFVAMDLIEGDPIVEYCRANQLSVRERVQLIEQVCDAVHHAHQRAVIHRDIKPANVLVERRDGRIRPRVIDFGIAKLLEDGAHRANTLTGQRLGTPRYMSPEQRGGDDRPDIRVDVYALGVLLCEVLTGHVPHGNTDSNRTSRSSTRPSVIAATRVQDRAVHSRELKGDLDQIVLKAIHFDPGMRYQSAAAMADDLGRYLSGMPVLAKEAGLAYRGIRFVQRHKVVSSFALITILAIGIGTAGLLVGFHRARISRDSAQAAFKESERQLLRAEFVNRFLLEDLLTAIDPNVNQGRDISVREVFDIASAKLSEREDLDTETQYTTLRLIGLVYSEIGAHDEAMNALRLAAELAEQIHGNPCRESIEIRLHLFDLIVANGRSGRTKLSEQLNLDARGVLDPVDPLFRSVRLRTSESPDELRALVKTLENDLDADPTELLRAFGTLANLYAFAFMPAEELEFRRRGYELSDQIYGPDHSATFSRLGHFAALRERNHPDHETLDLLFKAYEPARRILGPDHPVTLSSMRTYADLLGKLGDSEEAIRLLEECERGIKARFGESSTHHTAASSVLGEHYLRAGQADKALGVLLQVREDRARQWSAGHMLNVIAHLNVTKCYLELGEAELARDEALVAMQSMKPGSLREALSLIYLAQAHAMLEQPNEADEYALRAVEVFAVAPPANSHYFTIGEGIADGLDFLQNTEHALELRALLERSKTAISD